MPVYKYMKGATQMWYVKANYQDETGANRQHCKRGFKTKKEAQSYEREFLLNGHTKPLRASQEPVEEPQPTLTFQRVFEEYWTATVAKGLTAGTQETKRNMLYNHVLPYFQAHEITAITVEHIRQWQCEMRQKQRRGRPFSETYLHSVQSQLNAVLNYATCKKYIPFSPMVDLKNLGEKNAPPREIWTPAEYERFANFARTRPDTFMLFELYYWMGLRRGEGLGIRPCDIRYNPRIEKTEITIATSVDAKRRVGSTKTASSYRTLPIPATVEQELKEYISHLYALKPQDRIFEHITVSHLYRDIQWAAEQAGVPRICIHGMASSESLRQQRL